MEQETKEFYTRRLVDADCGMNKQAALFMQYLSDDDIKLPKGYFLSTHPYCNCPEMGFCVSLMRPGKGAKPLNFAFYEHRNSDTLCCVRWEGELPIHGGTSVEDIPQEAFPDKFSYTEGWEAYRFWEAQEWLMEELRKAAGMTEDEA